MTVSVMEKVNLGCLTFVTAALPHDKCGTNGLPLTPNSVKVLGLAQELLTLKQENICQYIDFISTKHNRIFIVSEYYTLNLLSLIQSNNIYKDSEWTALCLNVSKGIFQGLSYLHKHGFSNFCLEPNSIFVVGGVPKLGGFGLHHFTDGGSLVDWPIGNPKYHAPEQLLAVYLSKYQYVNIKCDVWSAAFIILEMINKCLLWRKLDIEGILVHVLKLTQYETAQKVLEVLLTHFPNHSMTVFDDKNQLKCLLECCLSPLPTDRPLPIEVLENENIFKDINNEVTEKSDITNFETTAVNYDRDINPMDDIELDKLFHLWKLAGGDIISTVLNSETTTPSVRMLPMFITNSGCVRGLQYYPESLFDSQIMILSMEAVESRLHLALNNLDLFYPLLEKESIVDFEHPTSKLPMLIKENDFEYQVYRLALFHRLLNAYPYLYDNLWKEARIDIPVFVRGSVWAALLDVQGDIDEEYFHIDKETQIQTDRQIAVDIPRCHQYNALLSSPEAHEKLKRVLKAWLASHPHLSYWQGLDSLCAVFVHLNFNNEAVAYKSMSHFIDKYLYNFFLKDNSAIIQEYLVVFDHLVSFHDPLLSCHMNEIGFIPDLYAIPWFLTMFAHVFPLHKVVHLWDTLLLGNSSFPLCIGVAILQQVRLQLLQFDFNECILLFSDFPEVDIDSIVQKSIQIFCQTPKSSSFRVHAQHKTKMRQRTMSYYSDDYNVLPKNELSIKEIPLDELKQEVCCRISADDLIQLSEFRDTLHSKTPVKHSKSIKPRIAVVDIRLPDEFAHGAYPESKNFPFESSRSVENSILFINQVKPKVVVVIGSKSSRFDRRFAAELLKAGIKGVCVLFGGIEVLKPVGILTIPSSQ